MKKMFVVVLFALSVCFAQAEDLRAYLLEVQGKVEIKDKGSSAWKPAAAGDTIENETVISTSFKSAAVVSLGSSRLFIQPLTTLTLEEIAQRDSTEETRLFLRSGRVRADVSQSSGSTVDFTVRSPTVTASVRGTSFEFDGRHLWVAKGLVRLSNQFGQRVYVARGQHAYVDENSQKRVVPPFEAAAENLEPHFPDLDTTARQEPAAPPSTSGGMLLIPGWQH